MARRDARFAVVGLALLIATSSAQAAEVATGGAAIPDSLLKDTVRWVLQSPLKVLAQLMPETKNNIHAPQTDRDSALFAGD